MCIARKDPHFEDRNTELMDVLLSRYKDLTTLEMETFLLYVHSHSPTL